MARRGHHVGGPRSAAQRAALRKAQLASARKRRRRAVGRGARQVGAVVGGVASAAAIYHLNNYARHPDEAVKHAKIAHGFVNKKLGIKPAGLATQAPVKSRKLNAVRYKGKPPVRGAVRGSTTIRRGHARRTGLR